jgi:RNA-binding protein
LPLTNSTIKQYRAIGHNLKPVVTISDKGLTDAVINEIERALHDHELIKVKIAIADRDYRKTAISTLSEKCNAELVQEIGKIALIYRESKKKNKHTSNLHRAMQN